MCFQVVTSRFFSLGVFAALAGTSNTITRSTSTTSFLGHKPCLSVEPAPNVVLRGDMHSTVLLYYSDMEYYRATRPWAQV